MLDYVPWFDETYMVELGRLFLCGGDEASTLLNRAGDAVMPLAYVGPCLQELVFRAFGPMGVRLSPFFGLVVLSALFRVFIRRTTVLPRFAVNLLTLLALTAPLLFQSAEHARIDTWALACSFASLVCLVPPRPSAPPGKARLFGCAFFAVLSAFIWPTAVILAPLYLFVGFGAKSAARGGLREFVLLCAFGLLSLVLLAAPLLPFLPVAMRAFATHYGDTAGVTPSLVSLVIPFAAEVARAPFLMALAAFGLVVAAVRRKWMLLAAFAVSFALCVVTRPQPFRIAYLTPFFLIFCCEATATLLERHVRTAGTLLAVSVAYGFLSGPVGTPFLSHPTLPENLEADLAATLGTGPVRVFAPDHATYYIGRNLGWRQFGFAIPSDCSDPDALKRVLGKTDAAILQDYDIYSPLQQSCTVFGLFCRYVLSAARAEKDLPPERQSWAARFGSSHTTLWHEPLRLEGFSEIRRFGMIRVFVRDRAATTP